MFSGGRERVHWEEMGWFQPWSTHSFYSNFRIIYTACYLCQGLIELSHSGLQIMNPFLHVWNQKQHLKKITQSKTHKNNNMLTLVTTCHKSKHLLTIFIDLRNAKKCAKNNLWSSKIFTPAAWLGLSESRFLSKLFRITKFDHCNW